MIFSPKILTLFFINVFWLESMDGAAFCNLPMFLFGTALLYRFFMNHRITDHIWDVYLVYLWPGYLTELRILSWTMPHTFINCILGQWGGMQHKWYQGSKSYLIYFARVECKMDCPALVCKSRAGQGTLVSISKNICHETKAAALVTKSFSNQDKESISLLLTLG